MIAGIIPIMARRVSVRVETLCHQAVCQRRRRDLDFCLEVDSDASVRTLLYDVAEQLGLPCTDAAGEFAIALLVPAGQSGALAGAGRALAVC